MSLELSSELLNGERGIASLALAIMCIFYLQHEGRALRTWGAGWRGRLTRGMRVAVSVAVMSVGIFMSSAEVYVWRLQSDNPEHLSQAWLLLSGAITLIGFLCAIREMAKPLYGASPWVWTLIAMTAFASITVAIRLLS